MNDTRNKPAPANHWRQVHRRKNEHLLFAEDLGPKGTTVAVEVVDSGVLTVAGFDGSERMPWIGFRGKSKKLGLNPTNCKVIETLCGTPDWAQWRGWITLVVIRTKYTDRKSGERFETDAIRIAGDRPRRGDHVTPPADSTPSAEEQAEILRKERESK